MRYRRAPAGGGISIAVAVMAMSAVMRRAAARGAVPCRISPAVSFLRLVEYRFSSHRTVMSFRRLACRFGVSCRIRLCCMASCRLGGAAVFVSPPSRLVLSLRFASISYHRPVSSRHVRRYASLDTGGGKGVSFDYSYERRFLNNSVWFFNPASIWWNMYFCLVFPYITRLLI